MGGPIGKWEGEEEEARSAQEMFSCKTSNVAE